MNKSLNSAWYFFLCILCIKIFLIVTCSSFYVESFFKPFVNHFLTCFDNPWAYFYNIQSAVEFPYHPFMLYLLSFFYAPVKIFNLQNPMIQTAFFKVPIVLADLTIFYLLTAIFSSYKRMLLITYFASPIILYAAYAHSQLDLIPTALLFLSVFLLKQKRMTLSAICLGFALGTKLHIAAAIPLIFIAIKKNNTIGEAWLFCIKTLSTYTVLSLPFLWAEGFYRLAFLHPKQLTLLSNFITIGQAHISIPLAAIFGLYLRFYLYKKINNDLLDAFIAITFLTLVTLIPPAPAWYLWAIPFLIVLLVKHQNQYPHLLFLFYALNSCYILYYLFFYQHPQTPIFFLKQALPHSLPYRSLENIIFTLLSVIAATILYQLYKIGIKSNNLYQQNKTLVIGISGESGSGKSTLMKNLHALFGKKAITLEGDGDHRWERNHLQWQSFTHLHPKANLLHQQAEHVAALKRGNPIQRQDYDHTTGTFSAAKMLLPREIIMLSGLHSFYLPKMRKLVDIKIYLDPDKELQKHWKILRDHKERGHTLEHIINQIKRRENDAATYIDPQKKFADLIISYLPTESLNENNSNRSIPLNLVITLTANIKLDPIIETLQHENFAFSWDYADDLQTQHLALQQEPSLELIIKLVSATIMNKEELIYHQHNICSGYQGFVQLVALTLVSEKLQDLGESL